MSRSKCTYTVGDLHRALQEKDARGQFTTLTTVARKLRLDKDTAPTRIGQLGAMTSSKMMTYNTFRSMSKNELKKQCHDKYIYTTRLDALKYANLGSISLSCLHAGILANNSAELNETAHAFGVARQTLERCLNSLNTSLDELKKLSNKDAKKKFEDSYEQSIASIRMPQEKKPGTLTPPRSKKASSARKSPYTRKATRSRESSLYLNNDVLPVTGVINTDEFLISPESPESSFGNNFHLQNIDQYNEDDESVDSASFFSLPFSPGLFQTQSPDIVELEEAGTQATLSTELEKLAAAL